MKGTLMRRPMGTMEVYTSPVSLFREIDRALDDIFRRFFGTPYTSESRSTAVTESGEVVWTPRMDLIETPEGYRLYLSLPHVDRDSLKIRVQENSLVISGQNRPPYELKDEDVLHVNELAWGRFHHTVTFPEAVNWDGVKARYEHGLLVVDVPKAEERKAREIEIEIK